MAKRIPAADFVAFLKERLRAGDGYIFGATGQDPRQLPDWYFGGQYRGEQLKKALYWRQHAPRVWDCNGLAEGYYRQRTGADIDERARDNYASWCDPKGEGMIPANRRVPGAAVFKRSSYIHHVGFLIEPVDAGRPSGDWYVIEARGVMSGVIRSRLEENDWDCWGWMTRYFDYGAAAQQPNGDEGDEGAPVRVRVTAETAAYVRRGPGVEHPAITAVERGAEFPLLATAANGWRSVAAEGEVGWISPNMCEVIKNG